MESIIEGLFLFTLTSMNYQGEIDIPDIIEVSQKEIIDKVCMGKPCSALAYYDDKRKQIIMLESLDLQSRILDRSYVLHEMVHHVQNNILNLSASDITCNARLELEREAYRIQLEYLISQKHDGFQIRYILSRFPSAC